MGLDQEHSYMEECVLPYDCFPGYKLHLFISFLPPTYFRYQAHARWQIQDDPIEGVRLDRPVPLHCGMHTLYCWNQLGRVTSSMEE